MAPPPPPRSILRTLLARPVVAVSHNAVRVRINAASVMAAAPAIRAVPALAAPPDAAEFVVAAPRPATERVALDGLRVAGAVAHLPMAGPPAEASTVAVVDVNHAVDAAAVDVLVLEAHGCRGGFRVGVDAGVGKDEGFRGL